MARIRINFGSDFCGDETCPICFRDAEGVAKQSNEVSEYRSKNRRRDRFTNVPKFISNFYHESAQLAKKIETAAKEEQPNTEVEVKIVTTVKPIVKEINKEELDKKLALINSLKKKTIDKIETDLNTIIQSAPVVTVRPSVVSGPVEITFDMLLGRSAKLAENTTQYKKDSLVDTVNITVTDNELEIKK